MRFNDRQLRALKPKATRYDLREALGFTLRVEPTGKKTFYYIFNLNRKRKAVKIGEYGDPPLMTLAEARKQHAHMSALKSTGGDPSLGINTKRDATVDTLLDEYLEHYAQKNKKNWQADERALEKDVRPAIGHRKAGEIKRIDIIALLEKMHARGVERQVNIVHTILGKAFAVGLQRDFPGLDYNPCRDIPSIGKENERDRVLSPAEIRKFWDALASAPRMADATKRCLRTILLTGQRPGEVLHMTRAEIDGSWWTIPAAKYKTGITHRVYLTETARTQLGKKGKPFPTPTDHRALSRATARLCTAKKIEPFTPHDLRRTAATLMAENGVIDDHVDRVLGHKMGKIRRTYNRHTFDAEKQSALEILESAINKILKETD